MLKAKKRDEEIQFNSREPNVCSQSDGTVSKVCGLKAVYNDPTCVSLSRCLSYCLCRDLLLGEERKREREGREGRVKGVRRR